MVIDTEAMAELARRIEDHLRRFALDKKLRGKFNMLRQPTVKLEFGSNFNFSVVIYYWYRIHEPWGSRLTIEKARSYLIWLDQGNVGGHYTLTPEQERSPAEGDYAKFKAITNRENNHE